MKDIASVGTLVLAFATWVTVHVALAARLALAGRPRWRGLLALVLPPLAPIYGFRAGFRRTSTVWVIALLVYVVARVIADR